MMHAYLFGVKSLKDEVKQLKNKVRELDTQLSDERQMHQYRTSKLLWENELLSCEKAKLEKQLEDTRNVSVLFMNAADEYQEAVEREKLSRWCRNWRIQEQCEWCSCMRPTIIKKWCSGIEGYQEEVEKELKVKVKELNYTRMAGLLFMSEADNYQEVVEKEYKATMEQLKDTMMALMNATNEYQEVVEKESKLRELEELWAQNVELDVKSPSLSSELKVATGKKEELQVVVTVKRMECDVVKRESDKLHLKVLTLKHQLDAG
jgi:hypothetical protein